MSVTNDLSFGMQPVWMGLNEACQTDFCKTLGKRAAAVGVACLGWVAAYQLDHGIACDLDGMGCRVFSVVGSLVIGAGTALVVGKYMLEEEPHLLQVLRDNMRILQDEQIRAANRALASIVEVYPSGANAPRGVARETVVPVAVTGATPVIQAAATPNVSRRPGQVIVDVALKALSILVLAGVTIAVGYVYTVIFGPLFGTILTLAFLAFLAEIAKPLAVNLRN